MYQELAQKAIQAALSNDWKGALKFNLKILKDSPSNLDAMNRAARAYLMTGKTTKAFKISNQVLEFDPQNGIASKCIDKCNVIDKNFDTNEESMRFSDRVNLVFIEEPGKTKILSLINICEPALLATLSTGDLVNLKIGGKKVSVLTNSNNYIGRFPDDVASRVIQLKNMGFNYSAYIKTVTTNLVRVFIKEIFADQQMQNIISFPDKR